MPRRTDVKRILIIGSQGLRPLEPRGRRAHARTDLFVQHGGAHAQA